MEIKQIIIILLYSFVPLLLTNFMAFGIYLSQGKAIILDVFWPLQIFVLGLFTWIFWGQMSWQIWLLYLPVSLWFIRLGAHMLSRYLNEPEDPRYESIKEKWNSAKNKDFFPMFLFQGVLAWGMAIPFVILHESKQFPDLAQITIASLILWPSLVLEWVADHQLKKFKEKKSGGTCEQGLWRYSRHPNYFFEWTFWIGVSIYCFVGKFSYLSLVCPALIYFLLNHLTGIKASEEHMEKRQKPGFAAYKKRTNAFFPWFPKSKGDA